LKYGCDYYNDAEISKENNSKDEVMPEVPGMMKTFKRSLRRFVHGMHALWRMFTWLYADFTPSHRPNGNAYANLSSPSHLPHRNYLQTSTVKACFKRAFFLEAETRALPGPLHRCRLICINISNL
jgi:hypothetical protein